MSFIMQAATRVRLLWACTSGNMLSSMGALHSAALHTSCRWAGLQPSKDTVQHNAEQGFLKEGFRGAHPPPLQSPRPRRPAPQQARDINEGFLARRPSSSESSPSPSSTTASKGCLKPGFRGAHPPPRSPRPRRPRHRRPPRRGNSTRRSPQRRPGPVQARTAGAAHFSRAERVQHNSSAPDDASTSSSSALAAG